MNALRLTALAALACSLHATARAQVAQVDAAAPTAPETAPAQSTPAGPPPAAPPAASLEPESPVPTSPPAAPPAPASPAPVVAPPQPAGDGDAATELTPEELRALGLDGGDGSAGPIDTSLHLSGFMDATVQGVVGNKSSTATLVFGDEVSFFIGGLNLYLQKNLTETLRTMAEVRFTYLPNGYSVGLGRPGFNGTEVSDYAGVDERLRWGGIEIERAFLEWSPLPVLGVRFGQFLTPYGIWNTDHGSPVVIPTSRPYAVSGALFPERQTGLELFGRWDALTQIALGYHLTLSNGTGPVSEYRDLDSNKALGGRAFVEYRALGTLTVGASGYYGRDSAAELGYVVNADGSFNLQKAFTSQSDVTALGADVLWKHEGFHLQAEWVSKQTRYTDVGRPPLLTAGQLGIPANALEADTYDWAGYVMLGYRLPWFGVMPFATLERLERTIYGLDARETFTQLGLNIRPIGELVIKLEHMRALAASDLIGETHLLQGQVAWAF